MPKRSISVQSLWAEIARPDAPIIVDMCIEEDFAENPVLIPTSLRHPHTEAEALVPFLVGKAVIVVCQKGFKISQGAAAIFNEHGMHARYLEGGILGWIAENLPTLKASKISVRGAGDRSRWLLGKHGLEAATTAWIIRRFIDPGAMFLDVEPDQTDNVAEKFDAELATAGPQVLCNHIALNTTPLQKTLATAPTLLAPLWPGLVALHDDPADQRDDAFRFLNALYAAQRATQ